MTLVTKKFSLNCIGNSENHLESFIGSYKKILGKSALSKSRVENLITQFNNNLNIDDKRGGYRTDEADRQLKIKKIIKCLKESESMSIRALSTKTGIPRSTVQSYLKKL